MEHTCKRGSQPDLKGGGLVRGRDSMKQQCTANMAKDLSSK